MHLIGSPVPAASHQEVPLPSVSEPRQMAVPAHTQLVVLRPPSIAGPTFTLSRSLSVVILAQVLSGPFTLGTGIPGFVHAIERRPSEREEELLEPPSTLAGLSDVLSHRPMKLLLDHPVSTCSAAPATFHATCDCAIWVFFS